MHLKTLAYVSRPLGYDPQQLEDILQTARARNSALGITGMLVSRWDLFAQVLEGPADAVDAVFDSIKRDHRHVQVTLRHEGPAAQRLFADWTMRHEAVPAWLWSHDEVLAGRHVSDAADALLAAFRRLAAGIATPGGASGGAAPA
jgi:hypothetical protein